MTLFKLKLKDTFLCNLDCRLVSLTVPEPSIEPGFGRADPGDSEVFVRPCFEATIPDLTRFLLKSSFPRGVEVKLSKGCFSFVSQSSLLFGDTGGNK